MNTARFYALFLHLAISAEWKMRDVLAVIQRWEKSARLYADRYARQGRHSRKHVGRFAVPWERVRYWQYQPTYTRPVVRRVWSGDLQKVRSFA